jgi:hypothetical protein
MSMHLTDYIRALRGHDWTYEYSYDQRIWNRGREQRAQLKRAQQALDPLGVLWRYYAPPAFRNLYH